MASNNPRERKAAEQSASQVSGQLPERLPEPQAESASTQSSRPSVKDKMQKKGDKSIFKSGSIDLADADREADPDEVDDLDGSLAEEGAEDDVAGEEAFSTSTDLKGQRVAVTDKDRVRVKRNLIVKWLIFAIVLTVIAIAVALVLWFYNLRWSGGNDAEDFQGTWYLNGSGTPVVITDDKIQLTEDVAYSYSIDPNSKTIKFKFGNLEGQGRYRFSLDRRSLSIIDGEYDWGSTLIEDIPWIIQAAIAEMQGVAGPSPGEGEGVTALSKPAPSSADQPGEGADVPETGALPPEDAAAAGALPDEGGNAN